MKLTEMKTEAFIATLASEAPAPGGGSASALFGALGTALVSMVANLTVGKEKYVEYEDLMQDVLKETNELIESFSILIERDTEVYNAVGDAMSLPKSTEDEKSVRKEAVQKALKEATIVPFAMMELSEKALRVLEKSLGRSNPNAVSDLGVGALALKTTIQGAWLNVLINLKSIKDEVFVAAYRENGEKLLSECLPLADRLYEEVEKNF